MKPILPGATIGVLGSGQLGRMFAIAARRMGYRVHTLSPDSDTPTGQVSDLEINASYEDLDAVAEFARNVSAVTLPKLGEAPIAYLPDNAPATATTYQLWMSDGTKEISGVQLLSIPARAKTVPSLWFVATTPY